MIHARNTLQPTIGVFECAHHYCRTDIGVNDSQNGRPFLAGIVHNPVLNTLKVNGYRLQYIHGLDYFVNEQGLLDYMFPPKPLASALRIFDVPLLKMKRHISIDSQKDALYSNMHPSSKATGVPWFTFAHINKPSHADLSVNWKDLGHFPKLYAERTAQANADMLKTIDRIRSSDPDAVVIIYGDHGSHRYNELWDSDDPNAAFSAAGVPVEIVTLDQFGIMIAVASGGLCEDYFYNGITPVNIMRAVFACLSGDPKLLSEKAEDISLFKGEAATLWQATEQGRILPAWSPYTPARRNH